MTSHRCTSCLDLGPTNFDASVMDLDAIVAGSDTSATGLHYLAGLEASVTDLDACTGSEAPAIGANTFDVKDDFVKDR